MHCHPAGPNLAFLINQKPSFTLPLSQIANSNITNKTEVSLEIVPPATAAAPTGGGKTRVKPTDDLVELRFHIPGTVGKGSDDGSSDEDEKEGGEEGASAAQAFHDMIKERAEIGEGGGDSVVVFNEVLVLTPRYAARSMVVTPSPQEPSEFFVWLDLTFPGSLFAALQRSIRHRYVPYPLPSPRKDVRLQNLAH